MHSWQWRTWNEMPYLTCSLLQKWPHGFFTHKFWPRLPAQLVNSLHPEAAVYRVKQVHGNIVLTTRQVPPHTEIEPLEDSEASTSEFPEADGLVTEQEKQAVWVASADCTPVLVADSKTGQVAAIHAGWRGTAAKIVPQALAQLQAQGSQLSDLRIAMGPAIGGEVYQVSEEVAATVASTVTDSKDPDTILEMLQQLPVSPVLQDPEPGKLRLDVRRTIALQLEQLGIAPEQVAIAPYCTYSSPEHFFSYRRDNLKKVQWSGIVSLEPS